MSGEDREQLTVVRRGYVSACAASAPALRQIISIGSLSACAWVVFSCLTQRANSPCAPALACNGTES